MFEGTSTKGARGVTTPELSCSPSPNVEIITLSRSRTKLVINSLTSNLPSITEQQERCENDCEKTELRLLEVVETNGSSRSISISVDNDVTLNGPEVPGALGRGLPDPYEVIEDGCGGMKTGVAFQPGS